MSSRGRKVFRSTEVPWTRRNLFWLALGVSPALLALLAVVRALTGHTNLLPIVAHSLFFAAVGGMAAWRANRNPTLVFGKLVARDDGVRLDGRLLASKSDIQQGLVVPRPGNPPLVRLVRRGWRLPIDLVTTDAKEGRRLLHALGLDASQTVATFRGASPLVAKGKGQSLVLAVSLVFGYIFLLRRMMVPALAWLGSPLFLFSVFMPLLFIMTARTRIEVGADGFMTRWLWRRRFVPWSKVERVRPYETNWGKRPYIGVKVELEDGERILLPLGRKDLGASNTAMLIERMKEAIAARGSERSESDAAVLSRRGREPRAWLDALRAIGVGANADHRRAAVPSDRLWRIAEDTMESAIARASAAVALGPSLRDEQDRERLRVAARATASPKLRIVLQSAASDDPDDEALATSLAELEAGEAAADP